MAKQTKRQLLINWDEYVKNIREATPVPVESVADKEKRIKGLKSDWIAFAKYYFPHYASAEFGDFHKRGVNKIIKNDSIYSVQALAREHGKSVVYGLILPLFLKFTGKLYNMILVSHNYTNAEELLMPIMLNLENNQRLISDFGRQKGLRRWEMGKFVTKDGCSFKALGAKQSPRGSRNNEKRPDFVLIDDIDTDEESRNQKRIDDKWLWIEQALWPSMSVTGSKRFIFVGNIISKNSIIVKASKHADHFQKVNILDKDGVPSWHQRYSLEQVQYVLSKVSYASQQKEYFNNPITEGTVFNDMVWGKVPQLRTFKYLVHYGDPSPSNSETKKNSLKAVMLVGEKDGTYYIVNCRLEQTTNYKFIEWYHDLRSFVRDRTSEYFYMENNSLQDPFYEQVYRPLMVNINKGKEKPLYILPDERKKPDKFTRIEAKLEPLHRVGNLIFNIAEKDNPHMKRLEEQFEGVEPTLSSPVDGPDAVEGAIELIDSKLKVLKPVTVGKHKRSKYKF